MVPMIGVGLWLLAGAAMGRAVRGTARACGAGRSALAVWFLLAAFAIVLLFRPHEDIFGGQDPGAYLNAACSFARHKTLFHTDPLLAQVNERLRAEFFYGHSGFGLTKDACLWVSDLKTARIGPWFLPAYAVMMSAVAWLVAPAAVLYVAPLLGLLTAATLAMLAARLIRRPWAGAAAFLLYVLNPVVIWNARAPRAEMGAGFFLMIGWVLIFDAWDRARRRGGLDLTLGAICLGVAPFFHATAWHPVLASFAVLCWIAVAGRLDFLPVVPVAVLTVAGFIAQTRFVTDCYAIWRFAEPLLRHPAAIGAAGCLGAAILAQELVMSTSGGG